MPPELFQFTDEELKLAPEMRGRLVPSHMTDISTRLGASIGFEKITEEDDDQPAVISGTVGLTASALASSSENDTTC